MNYSANPTWYFKSSSEGFWNILNGTCYFSVLLLIVIRS